MAAPPQSPRRRLPAIGAWLLGVSMALLILLSGPLALFNPWFVSYEQARNDVPARLATTQAEVDRVTSGMLCDLFTGCDDFGQSLAGSSTPLLTPAERSHMRDVGRLVRLLALLWLLAAAVAIGMLVALRRDRHRIGGALLSAAAAVGTGAIILALIFAVDFNQAFIGFHEIFFPQGNYLFGPGSNLLKLFPEGFWYDVSLSAGVSIILTALVVLVVGWWLWRSAPPRIEASAGT